MRILTRYILGEVVSHAVIGMAVFTFVLFTRDLGRILDLVVRNSAPLPSILQIFFFTVPVALTRSEEHTSELQSRLHLVCRLLLEKKKTISVRVFIPYALRQCSVLSLRLLVA